MDDTAERLLQGVDSLYGGDIYSFCEDYYRLVAEISGRTRCQIIGHFDLVSKFNENGTLFDENHPRYQRAALNALNALLSQGALLEINTGAMSRGYRTTPYPAPFILREMGRQNARAIITTDAHSADTLLYGADAAAELAKRFHVKLVGYEQYKNSEIMRNR